MPGLEAAEPVHQPAGSAAVNPEHAFEDGAVDDGGRELLQLFESIRKLFKPFDPAGHEPNCHPSTCFVTVVTFDLQPVSG
jgi:hypothetical protein